ncbi:hypothetical protein GCM10010252_53580 [Streptomyces aureoverticillatus]|nr:hypothetical protein GCM10010252_53580 [Streptomyces aureoverticillatus]
MPPSARRWVAGGGSKEGSEGRSAPSEGRPASASRGAWRVTFGEARQGACCGPDTGMGRTPTDGHPASRTYQGDSRCRTLQGYEGE